MKTFITALLVCLLATAQPFGKVLVVLPPAQPESNLFSELKFAPPNTLVCAIVVGIVGGVVIWQILKLCKKIPPPQDPGDPPPTNVVSSTFAPATGLPPFQLPEIRFDTNQDLGCWDVSYKTNAAPDGTKYNAVAASGLLSATNITNPTWETSCTITQWISQTFVETAVYGPHHELVWASADRIGIRPNLGQILRPYVVGQRQRFFKVVYYSN